MCLLKCLIKLLVEPTCLHLFYLLWLSKMGSLIVGLIGCLEKPFPLPFLHNLLTNFGHQYRRKSATHQFAPPPPPQTYKNFKKNPLFWWGVASLDHISCIYVAFLHYGLCKCSHKLPNCENTISLRLHLCGFSPLWVFKCAQKLPGWRNHQGKHHPNDYISRNIR